MTKYVTIVIALLLLAVIIWIPVQHRASIRSELESLYLMQDTGIFDSADYPDGTRRIYRFDASSHSEAPADDKLIDIETGEVLKESKYYGEIKDGRVVWSIKVKDYTLWGRTKWICFGAAIVLLMLALYALRKQMLSVRGKSEAHVDRQHTRGDPGLS